jgi:hypothetical protein
LAEQPKRKKPPGSPPWLPAPYTPADAFAVKAMSVGQANEHQQQRGMRWIIETLCGTYDLPYRPGEDGRRDTDFDCGRQHVGKQIVKIINMPSEKLRSEE